MENTLEILNLSKSYPGFCLNDISFTLPKGYIMGLIGNNGAGKTTIFKIIMNLIKKQSGSVRVFGLDHLEHEVEIKSKIGFAYDSPLYYEHLTLRQLEKVLAPFYQVWDHIFFNHLLSKFKLPGDKAIRHFSRGMIMKAALVFALSHGADFILLDEPTSGLDPVFRRELLEILFDLLKNENKSVLFSTHITSDLERIADYITFIQDGNLVFSRTKEEILEEFFIVKGGNDVLTGVNQGSFWGVRKNEFGFEALTDDLAKINVQFGTSVIIEKANLEDIMYFFSQGTGHDHSTHS